MAAKKDLTSKRFGRLVVLCDDGTRSKEGRVMWKCQCDCGNITHVRGSNLTHKKHPTLSCGCLAKEMASDRMTKLWQDEDFKQMHSELSSKVMTKLWQDEDFKQMVSDMMIERWQDEEFKQMHRDMLSEQWQDEDFKQMQIELSSKRLKEAWQNEEYRQMKVNKLRERWEDEEYKQIHSELSSKIMKEMWEDEEYRNRLSGENASNWKGGITPIREYLRSLSEGWCNKSKQEVNYTCQLTGKHGKVNTHHLYAFSSIVMDAHNTYNIRIKEQVKDYTEEELKLLEDYVAEWHKDSSNAVVLCEEAHKLFHSLYGKGDNTKEQYEEFKQRYLDGEFSDLF